MILHDRINTLLGPIYKSLGSSGIVFGAADTLVGSLVIIFGQFSSLFDQMHKTLDVGVMIMDVFFIKLSIVNIVIGSKHSPYYLIISI